jgi:hypothetical protein
MSNPYIQVVVTYLRRTARGVAALAWIVFGLFVIVWIAMLFAAIWHGKVEFSPSVLWVPVKMFRDLVSSAIHNVRISLVLVLILSFATAGHLRQQFANPRARLLPHFARVHVAVGAVVVLCVAVLVPLLLACLVGCDRFGFLAIALFMSGILLWTGSFRWMGAVAAIALYFCIGASSDDAIKWINHTFTALISGRALGAAILLLGVGASLVFLAWHRLTCLNEDMVGYDRPSQTGAKLTVPVRSDAGGRLYGFVQMLKGLNEESEVSRVRRHARRASTSAWSRACRWQVGMPTSHLFSLIILVIILAGEYSIWEISQDLRREPRSFLLLTMGPWLIFMPAVSLVQFYQRRQVIGHEVLLPVARGKYFRELGLAVLLAQFQLWSIAAIATVVCWLTTTRETVPMGTVAGVLASSALLQFTLFAATLWLTRYPKLLVCLIFLAFVGFMPILGTAEIIGQWFVDRPYVAWPVGAATVTLTELGRLPPLACCRCDLRSNSQEPWSCATGFVSETIVLGPRRTIGYAGLTGDSASHRNTDRKRR